MTYRIRRRVARERRGLSPAEHFYLRFGHGLGFAGRDPDDGTWVVDERAARDAWEEYRGELTAEAAAHGYIPWAARHFDGLLGKVSPYEDLRLFEEWP